MMFLRFRFVLLVIILPCIFVSCGKDDEDPYDAQAPVITADPQDVTVMAGKSANLTVEASSPDGGFLTYQWYSVISAVNTGGTPIPDAIRDSYAVPTAATGKYFYYVVITNTIENNGDGGKKAVDIVSEAAMVRVIDVLVDFQNATIANGQYNNDSGGAGFFTEGIASFQNFQPEGYWYGFAYSQMHNVTTYGFANEFSAYVPNDPQENKFMVGYIAPWNAPSIEITFSQPVEDLSFDVANNTWAALAMKGEDPDQYARQFEEGDLFTLTITVTSTNGVETITIHLGEGTRITNVWNPIQVEISNVTKLEFSLDSTDIGDWGVNTPTYFCIDNIRARTVK